MDLFLARNLANDLIKQHGLDALGWRFQYDRAKRRLGCCNSSKRLITMSSFFVQNSEECHVKDTILHEIAHVLAGLKNHHNRIWKIQARTIGCSGRITASGLEIKRAKGRYKWICTSCGKTGYYLRRPKYILIPDAYKCKTCRMPVRWSY